MQQWQSHQELTKASYGADCCEAPQVASTWPSAMAPGGGADFRTLLQPWVPAATGPSELPSLMATRQQKMEQSFWLPLVEELSAQRSHASIPFRARQLDVPFPGLLEGRGAHHPPPLSQATAAALLAPQPQAIPMPSLCRADSELGLDAPESQNITTLMISNIPCRVTQNRLAHVLNRAGYSKGYDYLYLPSGGRTGETRSVNLGYAFVNFLSPEIAARFTATFGGRRFPGSQSDKGCLVRPAHCQGLVENVLHYDRNGQAGRPRTAERRSSPVLRPGGGRQVSTSELLSLLQHDGQ